MRFDLYLCPDHDHDPSKRINQITQSPLIYNFEEPSRLNRYLAQAGVCSRRQADDWIARGLLTVNEQIVTEAGFKVQSGDRICLNQTALNDLANALSVIYNKPLGIVSGQPEPGEIPAIKHLTRDRFWGAKTDPIPTIGGMSLPPQGRLDKDSHGLLILSNVGVISKALIGPQSQLEKEYIVRIRGEIFEEKLKWLSHGLVLDDKPLKPAKVIQIAEQTLKFILTEGRNRQIRRMCDCCELRVIDLKRIRIGPIDMGDLPDDRWRILSSFERDQLIKGSQ
jgi:23S rRNA pseudouridine2604 synthase